MLVQKGRELQELLPGQPVVVPATAPRPRGSEARETGLGPALPSQAVEIAYLAGVRAGDHHVQAEVRIVPPGKQVDTREDAGEGAAPPDSVVRLGSGSVEAHLQIDGWDPQELADDPVF